MRIKTRILLLLTSVAVVIVATLVGVIYTESSINRALLSAQQAHTIVRQVSELNSLGTEITIADVPRVQHQWKLKVADVRSAMEVHHSRLYSPNMLSELEQLNITFIKMAKTFHEEQKPDFSGSFTQARYYLLNHFAILLQSLVTLTNHTASQAYEHVQDMQMKRNTFVSIMTVFWIISVVLWSGTLWKGFMVPLKDLLKAVSAVSQGELDYRIPVVGNGSEMNGLIISFNSMMERLQSLTVSRKRLIDTAEQERSRIGRELHDGICQAMAGARLQVDNLQCTDEKSIRTQSKVSRLLHETLRETRRIVKDLRPTMLDDLGLLATLEWLKEQNCDVVEVVLHSSIAESEIPSKLKTPIFRIVQETLHNAITHGESSKVYVQITTGRNELDLSIEDNGHGFNLSEVTAGSGMVNIRERVAAELGEIAYDTTPGQGCCIFISFPTNKSY